MTTLANTTVLNDREDETSCRYKFVRISYGIIAITDWAYAPSPFSASRRHRLHSSPSRSPGKFLLRILCVAFSYANVLRHMSIISRAMDNYKEELSHK